MGIPEHDKCVKCHKRIRESLQHGNWRKVRKIRIANGKLKLKQRIREIMKIEFLMDRRKHESYADFMKSIMGKKYRRYGKYDD